VKQAAAQDERIPESARPRARIEGCTPCLGACAGVVIAPDRYRLRPVCTAPDSKTDADAIITQYTTCRIEQIGMLKIDLLGLKTLTVLHDAAKMVAERHGVKIDDLEGPNLNDPKSTSCCAQAARRASPV